MGKGRVQGIVVYKEGMREGILRHSKGTADGFASEVVGISLDTLVASKSWKTRRLRMVNLLKLEPELELELELKKKI
jgi:hypothetical protein